MGDDKKLGRYVTVGSDTYGPGDELPAGVADQIRNSKAWEPRDTAAAEEQAAPTGVAGGTASGARLATSVTVGGVTYHPDDPLSDEVAGQISNPKAWEGGKVPSAHTDGGGPAGSGTQVTGTGDPDQAEQSAAKGRRRP